MTFKRLSALVAVATVLLSGCSSSGTGGGGNFAAQFSRAIQVFPGIRVRVLGVNVGTVTGIKNANGGVLVSFKIDDPTTKLPANVQAALVPASLLGERYVQLFPAYQSGPALTSGATIPISRTAVPSEPDELLRSLQNYLGALNPKTVTSFVENAARVLNGNGTSLNALIGNAANVMATLAAKKDDLAAIIVEFNKLSQSLATRQAALANLIQTYNVVAGTLTGNRAALEGTITGLNSAALQLANLLVAHRTTLAPDIATLTRTAQTLSKNVNQLSHTGEFAQRLFLAASRAIDYQHNWLRLNNQGQELGALIILRLEQRLEEICIQSGVPTCAVPAYWAGAVPQLFCFQTKCPKVGLPAAAALTRAVQKQPKVASALTTPQARKKCAVTKNPNACTKARTQSQAQSSMDLTSLMTNLLNQTVGDPSRWAGMQ